MGHNYRTVFETSFNSNGAVGLSISILVIGLVLLLFALFGRRAVERHMSNRGFPSGCGAAFWLGFSLLWLLASSVILVNSIRSASYYTSALRDGKCRVTEGVVEVLHRQPSDGHDPGDLVRIGQEEFRINYFLASNAYRQTLAYGGALSDGTRVRIHHLDGAILKVEVAD